MKYNYTAYHGDPEDNTILDRVWAENTSRKIHELVTIEIKIELDKSKYDKIKKKYVTPIGQKIQRMFE